MSAQRSGARTSVLLSRPTGSIGRRHRPRQNRNNCPDQVGGGASMREFLLYWRPDTVRAQIDSGGPLDHVASEQLRRVSSGDHLWIVTFDDGRLYLVGNHTVGALVTQKEAERRLKTHDLWAATHHSIAVPGTAEAMRLVDISASAYEL